MTASGQLDAGRRRKALTPEVREPDTVSALPCSVLGPADCEMQFMFFRKTIFSDTQPECPETFLFACRGPTLSLPNPLPNSFDLLRFDLQFPRFCFTIDFVCL